MEVHTLPERKKEVNETEEGGDFICPECGSHKTGEQEMINCRPPQAGDPPWGSVLEVVVCGECKRRIPAHIGYRRSGITYEEARRQWLAVYRKRTRKKDELDISPPPGPIM